MKRASILFCLTLLCAGMAWAEEAAIEAQAPADAAPYAENSFGGLDLNAGGGCELPDLAGLSNEEIESLAKDSGFTTNGQVDAQTPMCPTRTSCPNITNCAAGGPCSISILGPCCSVGGGLGLCCVSGQITVRQCPCVCTGSPCALSCVQSNQVRWGC